MQPLLGMVDGECVIVIASNNIRVLCVSHTGEMVWHQPSDVVIHGTAPENWYTDECAEHCEHPSRKYHSNHVSWSQMWSETP